MIRHMKKTAGIKNVISSLLIQLKNDIFHTVLNISYVTHLCFSKVLSYLSFILSLALMIIVKDPTICNNHSFINRYQEFCVYYKQCH